MLYQDVSIKQSIDNAVKYINEQVDNCTRELLALYGIKVRNKLMNQDILMIHSEMQRKNIKLTMNNPDLNTREIILSKDEINEFKYEIKTVYEDSAAKIYTKLIKLA